MPDAQEIALGTGCGHASGVAGVQGAGKYENGPNGITDTDRDGLSDRLEKLVGTNAKKADTDGDQLSDADEGSLGTDLAEGRYTDADGVADGVEVRPARPARRPPCWASAVQPTEGAPGAAPAGGAPRRRPAGAPVGAGVGATSVVRCAGRPRR